MGAQIEEKKRVNYPDLDVMKLVMAFFVVEIHTRPFLGWPAIELLVEGLEVVAVPFFFLASAFLCFRGLTLNDFASYGSKGAVRVRRTIGKLLWLYLVWTALYLPVTIYGDLLTGKGLIQSVGLFVRGTVFVGENFCSWPLWYLLASVLAFSLVYLFFRGGVSLKRTISIAAVLLVMGYLIKLAQGWSDAPAPMALSIKIYSAIFVNTRNGLFEGFFYVAVGALLGMRFQRLESVSLGGLISGLIVGFAGCTFVSGDAHLPFCVCASLCAFVLSVRRSGADLRPHVGARNASTVIYLTHMFFIVLFVYLLCGGTNSDLYANEVDRVLLYVFALGGSAIVAAIVVPLSKRIAALKRVFGI